jgi:hemin uptake protein HemP
MNTSHDDEKRSNSGHQPSLGRAARQIALRENRIESAELFSGTREIIIAHGEETYRLRLTALNKLILTK